MHLQPTNQNTKLTVICNKIVATCPGWVNVVQRSANFDFIYESLKRYKFSVIPLVYFLTIGCSTKNRENYRYPEKCFEEKKKKSGLKFNPGLVLISLQTTGIRKFNTKWVAGTHTRLNHPQSTSFVSFVTSSDFLS